MGEVGEDRRGVMEKESEREGVRGRKGRTERECSSGRHFRFRWIFVVFHLGFMDIKPHPHPYPEYQPILSHRHVLKP